MRMIVVSGEAFFVLPVSLLIGFMFFEALVRYRWGGYGLWLDSLSDRLGFFLWPRPPVNVVRLIMPNGDNALLYNLKVKEEKHGVLIETPLGYLRSPEKGSAVLPLTAIYIPGVPNPLSLVVYALAGLIMAWLAFYYGYLFMGLHPDVSFTTLTVVLLLYIYMYYNAASTSGVEYHEYEVRGLAPPYMHAIPSSNITSPTKQAKYLNIPIHIKVSKSAKESLQALKRALGLESESEVAELLAKGEFTETIMRKAAALRVEATRVEEAFESFRNLRLVFGIGRITVGRVALMFFIFIVGLLVGLALGGSSIIVGPPEQVIHNATTVVHNASMGGVP